MRQFALTEDSSIFIAICIHNKNKQLELFRSILLPSTKNKTREEQNFLPKLIHVHKKLPTLDL